MTGWGQLFFRVRAVLDRLCWGVGELRWALVGCGAWPSRANTALAPDGTGWTVVGRRFHKRAGSRKADSLLMPESECLWGRDVLPFVPRRALGKAVEEMLWRVSPLPLDQVVAAWSAEPSADGGWAIQWGVCGRNATDRLLAQHGLPKDAAVFLARQGRALLVREQAWLGQVRRQSLLDVVGCIVLILTLIALLMPALMPLVLKRQDVVRAVSHVNALVPKAAPLRQKIDDLRVQADIAEELRQSIRTDLPLASVVDVLSVALPGDAWLDRIEINGGEIRITGLTSNATELLAHLGRQPGLSDVKATAANVRDASLGKERFTFEMRWRNEGARP